MKITQWQRNQGKEKFYEIFNISSAQTAILYNQLIFVKIKHPIYLYVLLNIMKI